ncbi:hypothetical protein KIM67_10280 [Flagellimonas sp. 389]|uniref:DUF5777 family beta-barrel protein n=1 Tax=Flagellimonas sp. 389 TaxID=2835862 RepID=UPI001BD4BBDB|nr:DUF5777 family beta-barrel protein [Flagellimonas sp. 389]MBS9462800.1 hypothetical protein [Flagellimonas sp. 389]
MRTRHFTFLHLVLVLGFSNTVVGQDLLNTLEKERPETTNHVQATFKTTRISLGHSVETRKKGTMELSANTRFWNIPESDTQAFLVDRVSTRFGISHAFSDRFTLGAGVTTFDGIFDSYFKYKLLKQVDEGKGWPFTITLLQNANLRTSGRLGRNFNNDTSFSDKLSFTSQLLIARKFTRNFSLQLSPTFIHRNSTRFEEDPTNHFALGIGGRYKVGGHVSISSEYYYLANPVESIPTYDAFSIGVNWELTDLMLQFHVSNTLHIAEDAFITQNRRNFNTKNGSLFFGLNAVFLLHFKNQLKK